MIEADTKQPRAYWSGVFAISLCAFVLIAAEFMPVSLLTPIAADLQITEGQAGWGIGISGLFAVVAALCLPALMRQCDRRSVLLVLAAVMGLSGLCIAMATHYVAYLGGRALIGLVVGGFWSMSAALGIRLVPADKVAKAMALINGGNALATILAAPLGSYLGALMGWRAVFLMLLPLSLMVLFWLRYSLPALPPLDTTRGADNRLQWLFSQRLMGFGMLVACGLFFMGQFGFFTYIRPFLESVTGIAQIHELSLVLLFIGSMGFIGNLLIARVLQRGLYATLCGIALLMGAVALALLQWGAVLWLAVLLLGAWGLLGTAAPVGWWSWLAKHFPHRAEAAGGLMVAVIQLAIGGGSLIGGRLLDSAGFAATLGFCAALLFACAALCALLAGAVARRHPCQTAKAQNASMELLP